MLYAGLAAVAIALQWLLYRYYATSAPAVILTSGMLIDAVLTTIVSAQAKGDIDGSSPARVWSRVLERLWAVVIVVFIVDFVTSAGLLTLAAGDLADRIVAIPILLIAAATIYAESIAAVVDDEQWWFLVVRAIGSSVRTSWTGSNLWRAIALFALQFVPTAVGDAAATASAQHHVTLTSFWTDVPLGIVYSIPLDALIVLAFFDASGYEPKRTCGE